MAINPGDTAVCVFVRCLSAVSVRLFDEVNISLYLLWIAHNINCELSRGMTYVWGQRSRWCMGSYSVIGWSGAACVVLVYFWFNLYVKLAFVALISYLLYLWHSLVLRLACQAGFVVLYCVYSAVLCDNLLFVSIKINRIRIAAIEYWRPGDSALPSPPMLMRHTHTAWQRTFAG